MEIAEKDGAHLSLLRSMFDPYLFILGSYLIVVVSLLVYLTRSAIVDDLVSIPNKPRAVKQQLAKVALSLASTWYYMIKYMFSSYSAHMERVHITGGVLTTIPQCDRGLGCMEKIAAAKLMRVSSWLRETSLFKEAWVSVSEGTLNWWWSVEVCIFTVGVMALQLRTQERKKTIPHLWAYMLLGQTVAISVAWNLFETAVVMRKWLIVASRELSIVNNKDRIASSSAYGEESSSEEDSDLSSSASSDEETSSDEEEESGEPTLSQHKTLTTSHSEIRILSLPRYGDLIFSLVMISAGLMIVSLQPATLEPILFMHLCPFLLLIPIPLPVKPVSPRWRWIMSTSTIYTIIAAFSAIIRLKTHWNAWPQYHLLLSTFIVHPAQSSISSDAVCIALSIIGSLYTSFKSQKWPTWMLLLVVPLFGPSAVLAAWHAYESKKEEAIMENIWQQTDSSGLCQKKDMFVTDVFVPTYVSKELIQKSKRGTHRL